jgi:hypothetical protein
MADKYAKVNDQVDSWITSSINSANMETAQLCMLRAISWQLTKISDQLNDINRASWAEVKIMKQGGPDDAANEDTG